jgi:hypothetical protein
VGRILRIIGFLIIAGLFFWLTKTDFNFFDVYLFLFLVLSAVILFIINLYKDIKQFKAKKTFTSFLPTMVCTITAFSVWAVVENSSDESKSPIILFASYDSGVAGSWFEFRKDSTYRFTSANPLGESKIEGTYQIKDSVISISQLPEGNLVKSNQLVLRYNPKHAPEFSGKSIWQTDKHGNVDSSLTIFTVYNVENPK